MAKSPKGLHHHVVVLKGRVFVTDGARGPGEHTHLLSIGDDVAETAPASAADLAVVKSVGCATVATDHAHTIEMFDGTAVETLLPGDLVNADVRKRLEIELCEVVFWKERFVDMATAARWLDEQRQHWDRQTESPQFITFTIRDRSHFNQASLRTVHLSDGVDAVIGILVTVEPDVPEMIDDPEPIHREPVEPIFAPDLPTFDQMRSVMVAGYEMFGEDQAKALSELRDDLATDLLELHKAVATVFPTVVGVLNGCPDEMIEADVFLAACERAEAGLTLLADGLPDIPTHKGLAGGAADLEALAPAKWRAPITVPAAVAKQAQTGLDWHDATKRGGTVDVLSWASELADGGTLDPETVLRIRKQHVRHHNNRGFDTAGTALAGEVTWRLLGGDAGERWIAKTAAQLDNEQASLARVVAAHADVVATKALALAEVFEGSSFDHFALVLKSTAESCRVVADNAPPAPAPVRERVPSAKADKATLVEAQKARAATYDIEILADAGLAPDAGFPAELDQYGDPVNFRFPVDTVARARNARVRFKTAGAALFKTEKSKAVVHERIVRAELRFGADVDFDPDCPLDRLLPEDLQAKLGHEPVQKSVRAVPDPTEVEIHWDVRIVKAAKLEERTVFGIVLEPDVTDLHGDTYDEDVVRQAAWSFMEDFADTGLQHELIVTKKVRILESYVAPVDMEIETDSGTFTIKKGTWLFRVRVRDDDLWESVKKGEFTGFSFGGVARVQSLVA